MQHVENGLAVFGVGGVVTGVEGIAGHLTELVLPIDPGAGLIEMLPRTARQPGLVHRRLLLVKDLLILDQEVRHLPG